MGEDHLLKGVERAFFRFAVAPFRVLLKALGHREFPLLMSAWVISRTRASFASDVSKLPTVGGPIFVGCIDDVWFN